MTPDMPLSGTSDARMCGGGGVQKRTSSRPATSQQKAVNPDINELLELFTKATRLPKREGSRARSQPSRFNPSATASRARKSGRKDETKELEKRASDTWMPQPTDPNAVTILADRLDAAEQVLAMYQVKVAQMETQVLNIKRMQQQLEQQMRLPGIPEDMAMGGKKTKTTTTTTTKKTKTTKEKKDKK